MRHRIAEMLLVDTKQTLNDFDISDEAISGDVEFHAGIGALADAIIAALPDMIPDLVWVGFTSGPYEIVVHEGGIADLFCHAVRDEDGLSELLQGGYLTLVSLDDLKDTAETHHRAAIMAALGVTS